MKNENLLSQNIRVVSPYSITHHFKVRAEFEQKSLLEMMNTRFPYRSSSLWRDKIERGNIGVNGNKVEPEHILSAEDEIFHFNERVVEPSVPDAIEVIDETEDYLIVLKPAPMPMHPGGRYNKNSLTSILEEQGFSGLKIVHRLDAVTSGLVLLAKNKTFAKQVMRCFSEAKVQKTYYAHVAGNPVEDEIVIDAPIYRKTGFVFACRLPEDERPFPKAKEARTSFKVMERGENSSIIKCEPITGRTHQIRLHLENWGYPIIDDPIYGPNGDKSSTRAQNIGISLLNAGLKIKELGIDYQLENRMLNVGDSLQELVF